ncbi:MAG: T9SS type A sorting domain-containing protein [Bacteroidales bacterium]|nr:T9SS type A sorting domain-containing protein [Bacteroidales bacterium]
MQHKLTIPLLFLLLCGSLRAQSGFVTAGVDVSGSNGSISASVGQLMVGSAQGKATAAQHVTASLNEGLQQTYTVQELTSNVRPDGTALFNVYPNPTTDGITILPSQFDSTYRYALYTVDGRLMQDGEITYYEQYLPMGSYPSGSYILTIVGKDSEYKYRIVKIK